MSLANGTTEPNKWTNKGVETPFFGDAQKTIILKSPLRKNGTKDLNLLTLLPTLPIHRD